MTSPTGSALPDLERKSAQRHRRRRCLRRCGRVAAGHGRQWPDASWVAYEAPPRGCRHYWPGSMAGVTQSCWTRLRCYGVKRRGWFWWPLSVLRINLPWVPNSFVEWSQQIRCSTMPKKRNFTIELVRAPRGHPSSSS